MCTVANTTVSLGRPLCPAHLAQHLFPSVLYSPCPTISAESSHIHMHSHTYTHMHACTHPACLSVSYISLPINATSAEHSYRLSHIVTHAHAPTTHTHTLMLTHIHTHMHTRVFYTPGHLAVPWIYCGFPRWCSCKESACKCRRCKKHRSDSWVWKIPWMRKWQPPLVFLPGKSH